MFSCVHTAFVWLVFTFYLVVGLREETIFDRHVYMYRVVQLSQSVMLYESDTLRVCLPCLLSSQSALSYFLITLVFFHQLQRIGTSYNSHSRLLVA